MIVLQKSGPLLMVDDDELDIDLFARCVTKSRLTNEFKAFTSGPDFLEHMEQVRLGVEQMPAMVFLDINMPVMNGFTVLEELRKREEFAQVPVIIFLSSSDNPGDIERSTELNAVLQPKFERISECVNFLEATLSDAPESD